MNLWVWSRSAGFRLEFSLQGFCVLYIILSEFLIKDVLECKVSSTYLIECCDCTPFNLILKITILLTFNTTHKMECYEYWYSLGWYNLWCVKLRSLNYPFHGRNYIIQLFFLKRDTTIITFSFALFYFIFCPLFLIFTFCDFQIPIKYGFVNFFLFYKDMNCFYMNTLTLF